MRDPNGLVHCKLELLPAQAFSGADSPHGPPATADPGLPVIAVMTAGPAAPVVARWSRPTRTSFRSAISAGVSVATDGIAEQLLPILEISCRCNSSPGDLRSITAASPHRPRGLSKLTETW